jgi:hypothetical protein
MGADSVPGQNSALNLPFINMTELFDDITNRSNPLVCRGAKRRFAWSVVGTVASTVDRSIGARM